jgi:hypothetical protein
MELLESFRVEGLRSTMRSLVQSEITFLERCTQHVHLWEKSVQAMDSQQDINLFMKANQVPWAITSPKEFESNALWKDSVRPPILIPLMKSTLFLTKRNVGGSGHQRRLSHNFTQPALQEQFEKRRITSNPEPV